MNDLISRQAAIDEITEYGSCDIVFVSVGELKRRLEQLPTAQPEYTEHEESILTMLFEITKLIIDLQGGYMEMTDGRSFDNNDLFRLAEKLGINY